MKNTLVDSSFFIALFDRDDKYYNKAIEFLKNNLVKMLITMPVITEIFYILCFNLNVQINFLEWIVKGAVELADINNKEILEIANMMRKYLNVSMDLADASLMFVADKYGIENILSFDRDFYIYK